MRTLSHIRKKVRKSNLHFKLKKTVKPLNTERQPLHQPRHLKLSSEGETMRGGWMKLSQALPQIAERKGGRTFTSLLDNLKLT